MSYLTQGTAGNEQLFGVRFGGLGQDTILAGDGDDTVYAYGPNEVDNGPNLVNGEGGNDMLYGGRGPDTLIGGTGDDSMSGSLGDDVFEVDSIGDMVFEQSSQGVDEIRTSVDYTLPANVENLVSIGLNLALTGNSLANVIVSDLGDDTVSGGAGSDTITTRSWHGSDCRHAC